MQSKAEVPSDDYGNLKQRPTVVREPVLWFTGVMESKLRENDHKGGWAEADFSVTHLVFRIEEELQEVRAVLRPAIGRSLNELGIGDLVSLVREYADLANFAMMGADQARKELESRTGVRI